VLQWDRLNVVVRADSVKLNEFIAYLFAAPPGDDVPPLCVATPTIETYLFDKLIHGSRAIAVRLASLLCYVLLFKYKCDVCVCVCALQGRSRRLLRAVVSHVIAQLRALPPARTQRSVIAWAIDVGDVWASMVRD
jgi:hypothetical protein